MTRRRIITIILVIGASLVGSYYIIKNSIPSPDAISAQENSLNSPNSQDIVSKNPINWLAQAVNSAGDLLSGENDSSSSSLNDNSQSQNSQNLTELVAGSLFNQMKILDQSGSNPFSSSTLNLDNPDNQKLISDAINQFKDPNSLFGDEIKNTIDDKDIKITDNSIESKSKYLETTGKIILDNSNDYYNNPEKALNMITDNGDMSGVKKIAQTYSDIYNSFLNTPVPATWIDLHKEYLVFLKKAQTVYEGIADLQNDPIKSQLLAQLVPDIANAELVIKQKYLDRSLNLNL